MISDQPHYFDDIIQISKIESYYLIAMAESLCAVSTFRDHEDISEYSTVTDPWNGSTFGNYF
jgi:hypothetical protein